jgi:hypothetical protein
MIQADLDISVRPYVKRVDEAKRAGDMVQVVENIPSKFKVLNSTLTTAEKELYPANNKTHSCICTYFK